MQCWWWIFNLEEFSLALRERKKKKKGKKASAGCRSLEWNGEERGWFQLYILNGVWAPPLPKLEGLQTQFSGPRMNSMEKKDMFQIKSCFRKRINLIWFGGFGNHAQISRWKDCFAPRGEIRVFGLLMGMEWTWKLLGMLFDKSLKLHFLDVNLEYFKHLPILNCIN